MALARGAFYAFIPRGDDRDAAEEQRVQALLSGDLRVEPDAERRISEGFRPATILELMVGSRWRLA